MEKGLFIFRLDGTQYSTVNSQPHGRFLQVPFKDYPRMHKGEVVFVPLALAQVNVRGTVSSVEYHPRHGWQLVLSVHDNMIPHIDEELRLNKSVPFIEKPVSGVLEKE